MEEASRTEVSTLTGAMTHREAARSRQLYHILVLSCAGGAMQVMKTVLDGEGHAGFITRTILDCPDDVQGCSLTS